MLRAFVWLVSNVVSTLRTIFNRPTRDWHTGRAEDGQLPNPSDIHQEPNLGPPGSRPAVDAQRRTGTLRDHASTPILRDDRRSASIPQDEACGRRHKSQKALMLRDREAIVSKHGGVLTDLSPLIPTNVGIQERSRRAYKFKAASHNKVCRQPWIPTFVGKSGYPTA